MASDNSYHHGLIIKEFRKQQGMTLTELAERWPAGSVSTRYVQSIEAGDKRIADQSTLRDLANLLDIPLWRFGLSEFNPFNPHELPGHGERIYNETLDVVEHLVDQTWHMRRVAPMPETLKSTKRLISLFEYLRGSLPTASRLEKRFLRMFAQVQRLNAIMQIERREYTEAFDTFKTMHRIAIELGEPPTIALALMGVGTELERAGKRQGAIEALEEARDASFEASRQIAALVNAYLARAYAGNKDAKRFERAIDTAQAIATNLGSRYGDGTDYVYHTMSGILAERSYGYLEIGEPQKTLALGTKINIAIDDTRNTWLNAWIPLDWARAYLMLGEYDESLKTGAEFFRRAAALQSPHAITQAYAHLLLIHDLGHANLQVVKDSFAEIQSRL
jgi:transcriptional regulator with XRE-family HTH domain